jgi:glycosyltransferase involved in cell wall biosynthesis
MLEALKALPGDLDFELVVVGKPEPRLLRLFEARFAPTLRTRTTFRDFLDVDELAKEMSRATVLLFPTRGDNSPNAVKEAVVGGLPVVASDIGGIPDYVFPGENGVLFPAGSVPGCVEAIRRACGHPLLGAGRVEPAALDRVRAYLSPREMGARFLKVYERALASAR